MVLQHSISLQHFYPHQKGGYVRGWRLSPAKLSSDITKYVWSPIVWKDDYYPVRVNFEYADWCVLDFDDTISIDQAIDEVFYDYAHIIAPTKSHSKYAHCFRVCIPFEKRIDCLDVYESNLKHYARKYGADPQPTHGGSYFSPSSYIASKNITGQKLAIVSKTQQKKKHPWNGKPRYLSRWAQSIISRGIVREGVREITAYRLAKDLLETGMKDTDVLGTLLDIEFVPPLDKRNLEARIHSAWKHLEAEVEQQREETNRDRDHQ